MDPFIHLEAYPFVICSICQVGCIAGEVISHLRGQHDISLQEARRTSEIVARIPGIIINQKELGEWESPPPTTAAIPHIAPPAIDGLGCQKCTFVTRQRKWMQTHCRTKHGWVNNRKGGRISKAKEAEAQKEGVPWRTGVHCQRFFRHRAASHWFEVARPVLAPDETHAREGEEDAATFIKRIQKEDRDAFQSEAKALIQEGDNKWEFHKWLNRTGWSKHLNGLDRDKLRSTREPIQDDEAVLARMHGIFMVVMDKSYAAVGQVDAGATELFEMERVEAEGPMPKKPFRGIMEDDSWARYKEQWGTLLCIWQRMETWEEEEERAPYKMTRKQQASWTAFSRAVVSVVEGTDTIGRYDEEQLQELCLTMVMSMLDHAIQNGRVYHNALVSALAVMGIGPGGEWVSPLEYTPLYSAVIKGARMMVLYQASVEREQEVRRREQMMDRQAAEETAKGLFSIVRAKVRRFMTRVSSDIEAQPSPMSWIIETRSYGLKIRYTTPGSESIDWQGETIIHSKVRVSMGQLADMMHNVVLEARRTMAALTMVEEACEGLPAIPWSRMEDRHGESQLGYSFLENEGNAWWVAAGEDWVANRIAACEARQKTWIQTPLSESFPYQGKAIRAYGRLVDELREQLWVLMHMVGGQPARSPEILGLRMCNTTNGGVRNIFIHNGMVCFVTMYHKGARQTDTTKVIHRYVPREVGSLLVWYMWLVLPFWQNVQGRMKGARRTSAFLWADEIVGEAKAGDGVRVIRGRGGVGKEDNGSTEGGSTEGGSTEAGSTESGSAEAGSTEGDREEEEAFMTWYRERKWTRDRALRALQRYGLQFTGQRLTIAGWRQMAIAIANKYLNKVFGSGREHGEDGDEDEDDGSGLVDSIIDLQAGHGSHVAGLVYARLFGQGDMGTMRSREHFQQVSMQWHRFFGMGAEDRVGKVKREGRGVKREMDGFDWEREHLQRQRFGRLHRADIEGQLRQMMGPEVGFRGMQERVIRSVMQGVWPIVQVTPTGGGKSLTFMLPAYCVPDGVTVVITPLVALENDMVQRCGRLGIDAYIWRRDGAQRAASIVFVTPESAVTKGFGAFVDRMHGQQKMDRVVVDECHTLLEWSKTFRPQMGMLGRTLQEFGVPVICLTATLKPAEEARLFSELGFDRKRVQMFRERTTRANIAYRVDVVKEDGKGGVMERKRGRKGKKGRKKEAEAEAEAEEEEGEDIVDGRIQELVEAWMETHKEGKVIVYGGTIKRVVRLAERLGCKGYWNKAGTAAVKGTLMAEWVGSTSGSERVIVATNALGLGVDVPDVRLVVHGEMPRALRNFVQESGRGGRDGGPSTSVVVIRERWLQWQLAEREKRSAAGAGAGAGAGGQAGWDADVVEYAEGARCRREVLDREMDGTTERIGCTRQEAACDVCQWQMLQQDMRQLVEETEVAEGPDGAEEALARAEMCYQASQRQIGQARVEARLKVMEEVSEAARFGRLVEEWADCCVACKAEGEEAVHEMASCPREGEEGWQHARYGLPSVEREMFEMRRFEAYSACFECGMPQSMCQRWKVDDEDGRRFRASGRGCQYTGVLVGMYVGLMVRFGEEAAEVVQRMMKADGVKMEEESELEASVLYPWLGGLVEWGGMQASRMCVVIYRLSQMRQEA